MMPTTGVEWKKCALETFLLNMTMPKPCMCQSFDTKGSEVISFAIKIFTLLSGYQELMLQTLKR